MSRPKILLLEPQKVVADNISSALNDYDIIQVGLASEAIAIASEHDIAGVIIELSLSGHSGFEFLYEFRSYNDWRQVPIVVYSTVKLTDEVLSSRSWQALHIHDYLYKPARTLADLKSSLEKALVPATA